jgi:hypothetical protein
MMAAAARTTGRIVINCRPLYEPVVMFVIVVFAAPVTAGIELDRLAIVQVNTV